MKKGCIAPKDIDTYIADFPEDVASLLTNIRHTIEKVAPAAEEKISYGIPTFSLLGNLVHFAAFKHHIGFYPGASGIEKFRDELSAFDTARGTVRFPLDKPIPYELIEKIVQFRVNENLAKAAAKRKS